MNGLIERARGHCELCNNERESLKEYVVPPKEENDIHFMVALCNICLEDINSNSIENSNHWRSFLNQSIWSEIPAIQVVSYRMLKKINESWASDLLNMMYLDESTQDWADYQINDIVHLDSLGHRLFDGDNVILTQDLKVKGAGFTAKRGSMVRRIKLVVNNPTQIEGKIDGQQIIILTKYIKRS